MMLTKTQGGEALGHPCGDYDREGDPNISPVGGGSLRQTFFTFMQPYIEINSGLFHRSDSTHRLGISNADQHLFAAYDGDNSSKYKWTKTIRGNLVEFKNQAFPAYCVYTVQAGSLPLFQQVTAYHQTSVAIGEKIKAQQKFRAGGRGALGAGMYFARKETDTNHKAHQKGYMIEVKLDMGRVKKLNQWDPSITLESLAKEGFDSVEIDGADDTDANGAELVIYDSDRITIINAYRT
jgi:hypothetical protein